MNEIVMPKLSDTMTEGRLVSWKKRVGEAVRRGDVIAEVETDKANMELEAFVSGVLLEIRVQPGEMAQVGTVIAVIGKAEEKGAASAQPAAAAPPKAQASAAPQEPAEAAPKAGGEEGAAVSPKGAPASEAEVAGEAVPGEAVRTPEEAAKSGLPAREEPAGEKVEEAAAVTPVQRETQAPAAPVAPGAPGAGKPQAPVEQGGEGTGEASAPVEPLAGGAGAEAAAGTEAAAVAEAAGPQGEAPVELRERAAPVVRRRARELGVDLSRVEGSGPEGRILLQDLERHQEQPVESGKAPGKAVEAPVKAGEREAGAAGPTAEEGVRPLSRLRAAIAKTVSESWSTIPHFTVTMDIVMDEAEAVRRRLKQSGMAVTLNDVVVKGVVLALRKFPQLNASFAADGMHLHGEINIGVAVGVPEGVLIPVIRGCQRLSLMEISQTGRGLVDRARSGALTEQEMSGGTFSVSNLGMYGVSQFSAVIYPSQAAVLAVGAVLDTAVVRAGVTANAGIMKVTLSADHRLVDGAYAAQFLVELKEILENPVRLLI